MQDKTNTLTPDEYSVIQDKGTEPPNTGRYNLFSGSGTYLCRRCGLALFRSDSKFIASCGWPSFDDELPGAIAREPDPDGRRTEILCKRCDAHLGHVFHGEQHTDKNLRHCVNSLSIDFVPDADVMDSGEAVYAAGCFWGVEHLLKDIDGVLATEVGYTGGTTDNPNYQAVCAGGSGYIEAVRVLFNPEKIDYEELTKIFFEIHDPTQTDGQGGDIGEQYHSMIFYVDGYQKAIAEKLIDIQKSKGEAIATILRPACAFWSAEIEHQHYYDRTGKQPYCHRRVKKEW